MSKQKKQKPEDEALAKAKAALGIGEDLLIEMLDEEVHDIKSGEAASINNEGLASQVEFIGLERVLEIIEDAKK